MTEEVRGRKRKPAEPKQTKLLGVNTRRSTLSVEDYINLDLPELATKALEIQKLTNELWYETQLHNISLLVEARQ